MESLVLTAFSMGFLGGVHCAAMCGGIVGALSFKGEKAALHLSYNAGRILSYTLAGAIVGGLGGVGAVAGGMFPAQMALFVVANALIVLLGLHVAGWGGLVRRLESAGGPAWRVLQPFGSRYLPPDTPARAVKLGLFWGWIPCGLVYSTLALALASGAAGRGALVMLAFGLGTLPNLLAAGLVAQRVRPALRLRWVRSLAGGLIAMLGILGLARIPGLAGAVRNGLLCIV